MRIFFAAAVCTCTWGSLFYAAAPVHAAEITDLASSFEKDKPFGFKLGATYNFSYKTASINRESVPLLQDPTTKKNFLNHLGLPSGTDPQRTEVTPDLLYTQRRQTMSIDAAIGLYQDLQLGVSIPLVLRDERQYDLAPNAGFNQCTAGDWSCVASSSTTYLDGIYPIQPGDLSSASGSRIFSPPVRGGSGKNLLDTINISLMGAPVSQRRDPTKPTWVIGVEAQVSVGNIMAYDPTRYRVTDPNSALYINADPTDPGTGQHGWNGVSDGVHRFIVRTALSHRFKYVDPYLGLWYMFPLARTNDNANSPWKTDYGFANKHPSPQQKAGVTFGFEATPLENKEKGHRLALDFKAGLQFNFLGRGYSEAWEMLAGSNALICDDQTSLGSGFNFNDPNGRPGITPAGAVTQGFFNPACRTPVPTNGSPDPASGYNQPRPQDSNTGTTAYYQKPFTGVTLIDNYLTFNADIGIIVELFHHARLRLGFQYLHDQGHGITQDDAGTTSYPSGTDRVTANSPLNGSRGCDPTRVDLKCPLDWNPTYRAVINQPGRRYRIDDVTVLSGSAMLQGYF